MGTESAGSVFGDNSFYRETLGTRRGGRHVAKRNIKVQVQDLVRVVCIVAPFVPREVGTLGNFVSPSPTW